MNLHTEPNFVIDPTPKHYGVPSDFFLIQLKATEEKHSVAVCQLYLNRNKLKCF